MALPSHHRRWGLPSRLLRICIAGGLLAWLLLQADYAASAQILRALRWEGIGIVLVALGVSHILNVIRWYYLIDSSGVSFGSVLTFYGIGLFSSNFLPTGFGGDATRGTLLARHVTLWRALFSVAIDRGMSLLSLSAIVIIGLGAGIPPSLSDYIQTLVSPLQPLVAPVLISIFIGVFILISSRKTRLWLIIHQTVVENLRKWEFPAWSSRKWVTRTVGGYCISAAAQLMLVFACWLAFWAIQSPVPMASALWVVIFASFANLVPVTFNGLGIVEGAYVFVLGCYGMPMEIGLAAALIMRLLGFTISFLGGLAILRQPHKQANSTTGTQ